MLPQNLYEVELLAQKLEQDFIRVMTELNLAGNQPLSLRPPLDAEVNCLLKLLLLGNSTKLVWVFLNQQDSILFKQMLLLLFVP